MPILTFKATEMKDAKVAHISLVDRAATRIPFKIIKQEKSMSVLKHLDLASVFKKDGNAVKTEKSEVIGVITMKADGFKSVKEQIQEAGFSVSNEAEMSDGSVVFGQGEDLTGEHVLVRLSDSAVVAVKSFDPYLMNISMPDGTSFSEVCKSQGFYPGAGTVVDVLRDTVLKLASKSDNAIATSVEVGQMFDEAKHYVMAMIEDLPANIFKLELVTPEVDDDDEEVSKACKKPAVKGSEDSMESEDDGTDDADDQKKFPFKAKKADEAVDVQDAPPESGTVELVKKQVEDLTTRMEAFLSGVAKAVEDVGDNVLALATRMETVESVAKATSEVVSGTVVLGSDGGDQTQVVKAEARSHGREIDTAFMPRSQRNSMGRR